MTITSGALPSSTYNSTANTAGTTVAPASGLASSNLANVATTLAVDSGVVATLGGNVSASPAYNALDLYNSIAQATGTATQGSAALSSGSASATTAPSTASPAPNVNAQWASILKADPAMAATTVQDSYNQGIVGTLSVIA